MEYICFGIASLEKSVHNVNNHQIRRNKWIMIYFGVPLFFWKQFSTTAE